MPKFPATSPTAGSLSDSVFGSLVREARGRAGPIYPLHVGDTYRDPPPFARVESFRTLEHPRLHNYAPVQGEPVLIVAARDAAARRGGVEIEAEDVQITCGATSGLSVVTQTILDPGDEVLLPSPFWPLVRGIVAGRGARAIEIPFFDRLADARFDPEAELERVITDRTTAVYVNTPNNPTGAILPRDVVDVIARVAKRHDLWVLCDEAYEELWYGDAPPEPVWARADLRERAIACHTLSKGFAMAGARIGFVHGPRDVMARVRSVQTFQTYCAPRPLQLAGARVLAEGQEFAAESRALYREAALRTAAALGIPAAAGGTFLFTNVSRLFKTGEDLLAFLVRCLDAGVLLTPGGACGSAYGTWARICFTSVPPAELDEALARLAPIFAR